MCFFSVSLPVCFSLSRPFALHCAFPVNRTSVCSINPARNPSVKFCRGRPPSESVRCCWLSRTDSEWIRFCRGRPSYYLPVWSAFEAQNIDSFLCVSTHTLWLSLSPDHKFLCFAIRSPSFTSQLILELEIFLSLCLSFSPLSGPLPSTSPFLLIVRVCVRAIQPGIPPAPPQQSNNSFVFLSTTVATDKSFFITAVVLVQHTATHYNTLQQTTTPYSTL